MIFPSRLVKKLRRAFRIVWPRLDIRIEVAGGRNEWRAGDPAKTKSNGVDNLLPVQQHRQRLAHVFILEERPILVPCDVGVTGNRIFRLHKLLIERRAARLLRVLNRQ